MGGGRLSFRTTASPLNNVRSAPQEWCGRSSGSSQRNPASAQGTFFWCPDFIGEKCHRLQRDLVIRCKLCREFSQHGQRNDGNWLRAASLQVRKRSASRGAGIDDVVDDGHALAANHIAKSAGKTVLHGIKRLSIYKLSI